jgi:hypothetical protein
MMPT